MARTPRSPRREQERRIERTRPWQSTVILTDLPGTARKLMLEHAMDYHEDCRRTAELGSEMHTEYVKINRARKFSIMRRVCTTFHTEAILMVRKFRPVFGFLPEDHPHHLYYETDPNYKRVIIEKFLPYQEHKLRLYSYWQETREVFEAEEFVTPFMNKTNEQLETLLHQMVMLWIDGFQEGFMDGVEEGRQDCN